MRALGEPTGSRRLSREPTTEEEPDEPPSARRPRRPTHARPSDDGVAEELDERTSPFPYAENFDRWVADEAAAPDDRSVAAGPPPETERGAETERRGESDESRRGSHD